MRGSILAAGLLATMITGAARADEIEIPGAGRSGPTFQRPAAENPEMRDVVAAQSQQGPTQSAAQVAGTTAPRR